ncbi:MAG: hypothetical protein IKY83_11920 [Proteobacteria bacterium]|nr:hypothetical protein [Pseudomonadota bacterium]
MKRVIINVVIAFICMLIQSNVSSAFGLDIVCQYGVIAIILSAATSMSLVSSSVSMLIFALLCDIFASGPIGVYAFCLMVVFAVSHALMFRFRSERLVALMIWSAVMSVLFELLLAGVYAGIFWNRHYFFIFIDHFWKDMIATALMTPAVMALEHLAEKVFSRKKTSSLS